jgi:ABC-type amino acid transport substrate-binding protein
MKTCAEPAPAISPAPSRRGVLATIGLLATGLSAAQPSSANEIYVVSDEWHDLTRRNGSGLYFDVIRMVFERQGVKLKPGIFPYARTVQMVREKKADAWVASFLKEKDFALYPKWHFDLNAQMVVFKKGLPGGFTGLPSLRNKRVGWLRDFGLDRYIKEPMKINEVDSIKSAFLMLDNDRFDYFIGAKSDIDDGVKKHNLDMARYDMLFALNLGLYLAFADTPNGIVFRNLWDKEMETLHKTDAFKAVYKKYATPYPFT